MNNAAKTALPLALICAVASLATISAPPSADAKVIRLIERPSPTKKSPIRMAKPRVSVPFYDKPRTHKIRRQRKLRKHIRHLRGFSLESFVESGDAIEFVKTLRIATRCSFIWHEDNGHGYRKIHCRNASTSPFGANRPWAYSKFRKDAKWHQSRAWQGRVHLNPQNQYEGDLDNTDHSREFQGNPYQFLGNPQRYQQSTMFGQKIYYPRAAWE